MQAETELLLMAAITIAFLHTLAGPDHYLPFNALSKSRGWSFGKTIGWTLVCGIGHVWSSVLLGLLGAALGWTLSSIRWLESFRGGIAGWALLGFGFIYGVWGLIRARQNRLHKHFDINSDGSVYVYEHRNNEVVLPKDRNPLTPGVM